ncbi:UNVERIFIED_CONTAM: hypothetical protein Sradi_0872300 [Sesamum radiatum]|uniref:RNase H type-1 domain-containing protein n=1 Tax=Sesamum radiatum TaxID=300843 RepID=A0AAW2V424_SESRA
MEKDVRDQTRSGNFMFWALGEGNVCFWHDCWVADKPLEAIMDRQYQTHESVHYYWNEDHWDMDKLFRTLPFNLVHKVASIPFDRGRPDKACWRLNASDGAAKANPGIAGAGCIIRDHTGSLRAAFYEFLGEQTNVYAELFVAYRGLDIALEMGISRLWIETDASAIISIINSTTQATGSINI